jgi:DNA (cytosine-5)-methyltransferase 1
MKSKPKLLDLYSCQGGASKGYVDAGFDVVGVDIEDQPRYPYDFHQADALEYLEKNHHKFDAVHASPPCQNYTKARVLQNNEHPDLIGPTRDLLDQIGKPYIIENVPHSPLKNHIILCGQMFDIMTYRHRWFESNVDLVAPEHPKHKWVNNKMGRMPKPDEAMYIVGNFTGVARAKEIMKIDWMNREGLRESIPPVYSEYLGKQLLQQLG